MGNRPVEEKRDGRGESGSDDKNPCYRKSTLRVQRDLAKWKKWNKASIQERGATIIDFALGRWRIGPTEGPEANATQISG